MKTVSEFLLVFLLAVIYNIPTFAQTDNIKSQKDLNTFNLYFINGYAISYNYYTTDEFLLRAHLDLSVSGNNLDKTSSQLNYYPTGSNNYKSSGSTDQKSFNVSVSTHLIYPVYSSRFGQAYIGAGPIFGYSVQSISQNSESENIPFDTTFSTYSFKEKRESTNKNYNLGLMAIAGLKTYLTESIGLFAEVHLIGGRTWANNKSSFSSTQSSRSETAYENTDDSNGWFYSLQFLRIGVMFSF